MRMIAAAAGAAFSFALAVPAGAASLVTAPGAIAPGSEIINVQTAPPPGARVRAPGAVPRGPRPGAVAPVRRGPVVRGGGGRGGAVAAGVAAGVLGGLLVGGALAQPEPEVVVVPRRRVVVEEEDEPVYVRPRCMSFRSYDPRTRSFIDRNGIERPCP